MAATKASQRLLPETLACVPPPLSPLDGYSKLEELQMLLQNAAAGGSLLSASAAEAAALLSGEPSEFGGEERAVPAGWWWWWSGVTDRSRILEIYSKTSSAVYVQIN